ncbi:gfo/Idh/MocA family oxidoreductase, partial [Rhizobium sp. TRM95111]|nr:gfo/Idh/MocA family oxidoreductase [Rhizobium alarense]
MIYKAVICGCGAMAKGWLKALAANPGLVEDVTIVGLVDLDRATAAARAAEFGLTDVVIGTDLETVLAETRPDILFDIVIPAARRSVVATG